MSYRELSKSVEAAGMGLEWFRRSEIPQGPSEAMWLMQVLNSTKLGMNCGDSTIFTHKVFLKLCYN